MIRSVCEIGVNLRLLALECSCMWGAYNFAVIEERSGFSSQRPPILVPANESQQVGTEDFAVSLYWLLENIGLYGKRVV